jgi:small redox-active disulfide protein 2
MKNFTKIQVLGSGCPTCKRLYETTKEAVAVLNLGTAVEHITDIQKILDMGVMQGPVLAINGRVILAGTVPNKEKIIELLKQNLAE